MAVTYRIDRDQSVLIATISGTLTEREIFAYQDEVLAHPELSRFDELIDMTAIRAVESPAPIAGRVQELAGAAASRDDVRGQTRLAIAAPGDLAFGLGRMYATYRSMQPGSTRVVQVFRSMDEAIAWLGIELEASPGGAAPDPAS